MFLSHVMFKICRAFPSHFPGYSLNGCNVPAMMNVVDIAPAHCGTLMGVCNGFSSFAGFFVPLVTTRFTEDDPSDPANWRNLFFLRDLA